MTALLEVEGLVKHFVAERSLFGRPLAHVKAVDGVSFSLEAGKTLALVGESGCGKSTVSRLVLRLIEPDAGKIRFQGRDLLALDAVALRAFAVFAPLLAVGVAIDAQSLGIGLFNIVGLPLWLEFVLAVLILDFAIWLQHLLTHKIPVLWRLHRVHHADRDMDVTTAIRFHPVEILLMIGAPFRVQEYCCQLVRE